MTLRHANISKSIFIYLKSKLRIPGVNDKILYYSKKGIKLLNH